MTVVGNDFHQPVMADAVVSFFQLERGGDVIDATCGGGSHTYRIIQQMPEGGRILAIDRDTDAVEQTRKKLGQFINRITVIKGTFERLRELAREAGMTDVKGVLFDLGISSYQIDHPERGFSYRFEGPLDLRMDRHETLTAAEIVNGYDEARLSRILFELGEERNSRKIAAAIVSRRRKKTITTTRELAEVICSVTNPRWHNKTLARVFQALRLEVNRELELLESALEEAAEVLAPEGRLVVISYHSLEDRRVKNFLRGRASGDCPDMKIITKKPVVPEKEEVKINPRARSAKMRVGEKLS